MAGDGGLRHAMVMAGVLLMRHYGGVVTAGVGG